MAINSLGYNGEYSLPTILFSNVDLIVQIITRTASTRVAEYAFQYARDHKRQKVSALHKANIMKKADGLFIECCRQVREGHMPRGSSSRE
jgi:isocitrate dehydrogenase (NAD+)